MADRAQSSKVVGHIVTGFADAVKVPKVVAYLWLEAGDPTDTTVRRSNVFINVVRKP